MKSFDVLVIGSGPGGYIAAIRAAQLGLATGIVEEEPVLGGVCLNWGCIPTKAILSAAETFAAVKHGVPGLVVEGQTPNYGQVIDASRAAADRLSRGVAALMRKNKIEVLRGRGRLAPGKEVVISRDGANESVEARNVILATGSTEFVFPGVQVDGKKVLTSREALESRELPSSLLVIGGGAVGLEFAYAYNAYGTQVTIVEMQEQILPGFDRETAEALSRSFQRSGMKVLTRTAFKSLDASGAGVVVTAEGEKGAVELRADQLLLAVGRRALVADLGLEARGVAVERGYIKIGPDQRTTAPGVWAIGDILGAQIIGYGATELINEIALAMTIESTTAELGETSHAHPTLGEMLMQAALAAEGRALDF